MGRITLELTWKQLIMFFSPKAKLGRKGFAVIYFTSL